MLRSLSIAALAAVTMTWPLAPPAAPRQPVTDTYPGGVTLTDPYRYMEDLKSPAVQGFFKAQAGYTDAVLARLGPGRTTLRNDIGRLTDAGSAVSSIVRVRDRIFYLERPAGANDSRLMVRIGNAPPRLLLDPDALSKQLDPAVHLSISNVLPTVDGTRVAIGIVPGGAENQTHTRIIDTATATLLPDDLPRSWFGATAWDTDGKALYYNQLPDVAPGHEAERELRSHVFRHVVGSTATDAAVFGIDVDPNVPFVPTDDPYIAVSPASDYAVGGIAHGVQNEQTLYVAPVAALRSGTAIPWRKVVDVDDAVTSFDIRGSTMFLLTHRGASNYKIVAIDLSRTDATPSTATTVVAAGSDVLQQLGVARDGLYVRSLRRGLASLQKIPWTPDGTGPSRAIPLPFAGSIGDFSTDPQADGAVLALVSWTKPLLVYALGVDGTVADTGIRKAPHIDTAPYTSREVLVPSTGGVNVPVSIVMKKTAKLDGTNPVYLEAYGAYGINLEPFFLGSRFAWLNAGGIYVVAHVRGGGELGEDWHLAGKLLTKQHTIDDAIATARYLIAKHYTSPAHLAIEGTSAGGIMVGGAITQHPELFAAAIDGVGVTDALRSESEPNGPGNVPEFGSSKTADGFKGLYAMDAYQHIVDGRRYPAVIGVTGINDPRVAPWQVAKFIARLQAASTSGRPVLMRVDYDAGHGLLAASRNQAVALITDEFSFLLWQCGSPLFAGIPTHIAATRAAAR